jgi:predicted O-methyltransferase YrrM
MQISVSQCHFLHLITKISKIKNVLEIGTFTGLSTLTIALALPDDGTLIALDKNESTNKIAIDFFKKANQEKKIKTIIKPALDSIYELKKIIKYLIWFLLMLIKKIIKIIMTIH